MQTIPFKSIFTFLILLLAAYGIHAQVNVALKQAEKGPDFNRSIENLEFSKSTNGKNTLKVNVGLKVKDKTNKKLNMNFDVVVLKNGKPMKRIKQRATKGGAITCAVTCAGRCPSIFGDGFCSGCGCTYTNWLTLAIGEPNDGDVFEVKLVNARKGQKDTKRSDNTKQIVYMSKTTR